MSVGDKLKALREERGLSIGDLSEQTHIGSHVIEDLERDDYSHMSAAVYGSGFIKIIAKHYGIDGTSLRSEFATQYQAWTEAKGAIPKPKLVPQKFLDRRGAPEENTTAKAAIPARENHGATPGRGVEKPSRRGSHAAQPAQHGESARGLRDDGFGDFFGGLDQTALPTGQVPQHEGPTTASAPVPEEREGGVEYASAPERAVSQKPPAPPPAAPRVPPLPTPQDSKNSEGEEPTPPDFSDKAGDFIGNAARGARETLAKVSGIAGQVLASRAFHRVAASAAILLAAAWICSLIVGGGESGGSDASPQGKSAGEQPNAPSEEVRGDAEPADQENQVPLVHVFHGSALMDNLIPPPDRYAK